MSSVLTIDVLRKVQMLLVATVLCGGWALHLGCASQAPLPEAVAVESRSGSGAESGGSQPAVVSPSTIDHPVGVLFPDPDDEQRLYQLVVIRPADSPGGAAVAAENWTAHREHLARLHEANLAATSGEIDDGRRLMILSAGSLAVLSERMQDDPYFGDPSLLRTAGFCFTVGDLCGGAPAEGERELQLVWFKRDLEVLVHGGTLAPAPFGPELGVLEQVAAAGAWGFGHEGVVFLDVASADEAEKMLSSWPIDLHPQWSYEVNGVKVWNNSFCR